MQDFKEADFRRRLDKATETVRRILHRTRNPVYAADVHHSYKDKFTLCNLLIRLALGSIFQGLGVAGLADEHLARLGAWSKQKSVSLRLLTEESCHFVQEVTREEESSNTATVVQKGNKKQRSSRTSVTKITEFQWQLQGRWELIAFCGAGASEGDRISIVSNTFSREVLTGSKVNPCHDNVLLPSLDVEITWILDHLPNDRAIEFEIDRTADTCCTPRRNVDVDQALATLSNLSEWCNKVSLYMCDLFQVAELGAKRKRQNTDGINSDGVLVPVVPLFVEESDPEEMGQLTFTPADIEQLLAEQKRSLNGKIDQVSAAFPLESDSVVSGAEVRLSICVQHLRDVVAQLHLSVEYVENMLLTQLYAAIGRHITAQDFAGFRRFHDAKLFRDECQPLPFSFAVRRSPLHSPEGSLAIEESASGSAVGMFSPVYTHVRAGEAAAPMKLSINAATTVRLKGQQFVHGWLMHAFSGQEEPAVQLTAQARQLSSFIVMVGRIAAADRFEPQHAMIVQNRDEVRVPLSLTTIPTPKEFRDAIQSLSPEQQDFCTAWRAMQLESTLFAVCVVQIKPLLERVLNLPPESLSKEIKLTQDLTELFITYQIPADLLTAGTIQPAAAEEAAGFELVGGATADKVSEVKEHVNAMMALIDGEKQKQLAHAAEAAQLHALLAERESSTQERSRDKARPQKALARVAFRCSRPAPTMVGRCSRSDTGNVRERMQKRVPAPTVSAAAQPSTLPSGTAGDGRQARTSVEPPLQMRPQEGTSRGTAKMKAADEGGERGVVEGTMGVGSLDLTKVPGELDQRLEALDSANAVRPTIISAKEQWTKRSMASLMSRSPDTSQLTADELRGEKTKAFELLDALTRSGALVVEEASLHVVVGATHTFDKSLVDTIVQNNVNPVLQIERSSLIVASTITAKAPRQLVRPQLLSRAAEASPALFGEEGEGELGDAMGTAAISCDGNE